MKRSRIGARFAAALVALAVAAAGALETDRADASVSIAASWETLIARSAAAAFVTPVSATAVWENGRIFTYTHVSVDRAVAGSLATGGDAWVRTLGGIVGNLGQRVEGEAAFVPGQSSLLFLRDGPAGTFDVTSRGQGQFPVVSDDPQQPPHLARSRSAGMLVAPNPPSPALAPPLAADVLVGLTVDEAARRVSSEWTSLHAP